MWIYEPKGKKDEYPLPIHSHDNIMANSTWADVIDSFIASTPEKKRDKEHLYIFFISYLNMHKNDALETFNIVLDGMMEVIKNGETQC